MAIYVKAFSLVLKTASKPLAKQLKHLATSNATLRAVCIVVAIRADAVYQGVMVGRPKVFTSFWLRCSTQYGPRNQSQSDTPPGE
jgi:hypothetical protein